MIRIPKENVIPVVEPPPPPKKKRRPPSSTQTNADYLVRHHKSKNRRRTNPVVALNVVLESIVSKLKETPESWPFHTPVSQKVVPDYYNVIKNPMDLQTVKENIKKGVYHTRDDFLEHISLIQSNCVLYNGVHHPLTKVSENLLNTAREELSNKEKELSEIEREINPLLDNDPQVGFSWLCENILSKLKTMPESWPFHQPVPVKVVPDYYDVIKQPMDLETLKQRCQEHYYQTRENFMQDVNLLYSNSLTYNGNEHAFTKTAQRMVVRCEELILQNAVKFQQLENDIVNQPDDDFASTNPPSVSQSEIEESNGDYTFYQDALEKAALQLQQGKLPEDGQKQVVTAGDEDEFVDIEGEHGLMGYTEQSYDASQYQPDEVSQDSSEYQEGVYTDTFDSQNTFDDFPPELYSESYNESEQLEGTDDPSNENIDLGLLLLQDLIHSDEDDDDSDEDIPLDDGDEDMPLDDDDYEMADEEESRDSKNQTRESEEEPEEENN